MKSLPIIVEVEAMGLRFDASDRLSIQGLSALDKQRTNECNELSESLRGLIRAGRLLMTRDHRLEEAQNHFRKGEDVTMLSVLDKVEARGEARGIAATARQMLILNFTPELIAQATGLSLEQIEALKDPQV